MTGALGGFTGVLATLWCTLRGMNKDARRAIIQKFNLALRVVTFDRGGIAGFVNVGVGAVAGLLPLTSSIWRMSLGKLAPRILRCLVVTLWTWHQATMTKKPSHDKDLALDVASRLIRSRRDIPQFLRYTLR